MKVSKPIFIQNELSLSNSQDLPASRPGAKLRHETFGKGKPAEETLKGTQSQPGTNVFFTTSSGQNWTIALRDLLGTVGPLGFVSRAIIAR